MKDEVKLNLLTLIRKKKALRIFFHFISFETVLIHSLHCSGTPSVLGLALNLGTTEIIGMCLSYCTDPSWRRQGNGLFFFFTMGEGQLLILSSPLIWDTSNQVLSVFGMKELVFDF